MIAWQLMRRGMRDEGVLAAMGSVRRELFVDEHLQHRAYEDCALPIGEGQTISQPFIVARTCELADVKAQHRVLEVGAGSGYQAAILGRLARRVFAIERLPGLAEKARRALALADVNNVEVVVGDGTRGYPPASPYDRIIVAAAAPTVPQALIEQLSPGGRLVIPVGTRDLQELRVIEKRHDGIVEEHYDACIFVPLVGEQGFEPAESRV